MNVTGDEYNQVIMEFTFASARINGFFLKIKKRMALDQI
jgi:hypothetical protein